VLALSRRKERVVSRAFGGMVFALCFAVSLLVLLIGPRRRPCFECGQRMQLVWRLLEDGRGAEYLICENCRLFIHTFRRSR